MDKLVSIIGLAPSEIPLTECLVRLSIERTRVREALARFRATPKVKPTKKTLSKQRIELTKALSELNLSPEELKALLS